MKKVRDFLVALSALTAVFIMAGLRIAIVGPDAGLPPYAWGLVIGFVVGELALEWKKQKGGG